MSEAIVKPAPPAVRRRAWRLAKAAIAVAALIWFGHFAYVRSTTPAARDLRDDSLLVKHVGRRHPEDRTKDWLAAAQIMGAGPKYPPPPSGYEYFIGDSRAKIALTQVDSSLVFAGPWTPETRPSLRAYAEYFETDAVRSALDTLVELRSAPLMHEAFTFLGAISLDGGPVITRSDVRQFARLLCARARCRADGRNDVPGAISDLLAVLEYCQREDQPWLIDLLMANACRALALVELSALLRAHELSPEIATELAQRLPHFEDMQRSWTRAIRGERLCFQYWFDKMYTRDAKGDGCIVFGDPTAPTAQHMGFWNVLAPLYDDRRAIEQTADWRTQGLIDAARQPWPQSFIEIAALDAYGLGPTAGPLQEMAYGGYSRPFVFELRGLAAIRAARIEVA